jgi:quercetin dioxygenase-like cupin family protein
MAGKLICSWPNPNVSLAKFCSRSAKETQMSANIIHVQKWPHATLPDESKLHNLMKEEGLEPYRWAAAPGDVFHAQTLPEGRVIYVLAGSITFGFPIEAEPTTLRPGDRLDLPADIPHNAAVGFGGVVCLEARRPAM